MQSQSSSSLAVVEAKARPRQGKSTKSSITGSTTPPVLKQQTKAARKAARSGLRSLTPGTGGTYLGTRSVSGVTLTSYIKAVNELVHWAVEGGLTLMPHQPWVVDQQLAHFLDYLFFEGEGAETGEYTLAAVLHQWPSLNAQGKKSLPKARQALKGWRKVTPTKARLPMPWTFVAAIAMRMLELQGPLMALLTVLAFHCYLRPGVASKVRWNQLVPPVAGGHCSMLLWTLNLHPQEGETPSKTGSWDETLGLGDVELWQWLSTALFAANRWRTRHGIKDHMTIADFDLKAWSSCLCSIALDLGMTQFKVVLYQLRHGGASFDVAERQRTLPEVKKRGGWRSDASVARYAKPARINQQIHSLSVNQQAEVRRLAELLPGRLWASF